MPECRTRTGQQKAWGLGNTLRLLARQSRRRELAKSLDVQNRSSPRTSALATPPPVPGARGRNGTIPALPSLQLHPLFRMQAFTVRSLLLLHSVNLFLTHCRVYFSSRSHSPKKQDSWQFGVKENASNSSQNQSKNFSQTQPIGNQGRKGKYPIRKDDVVFRAVHKCWIKGWSISASLEHFILAPNMPAHSTH